MFVDCSCASGMQMFESERVISRGHKLHLFWRSRKIDCGEGRN